MIKYSIWHDWNAVKYRLAFFKVGLHAYNSFKEWEFTLEVLGIGFDVTLDFSGEK
jgi:hypothetical protein